MPKIIHSKSVNPAFNLACEEYLLHSKTDDFILIYANTDSVIVGKHQNAYAESNFTFCREKGIPLHRRLSGGGTVFHTKGNLNFTFIKNRVGVKNLIDFKYFLQPFNACTFATWIKSGSTFTPQWFFIVNDPLTMFHNTSAAASKLFNNNVSGSFKM